MNKIEIPFRLPSLNQEEWKYIKKSNEYEISTLGNIRRNKRNLKISDKPIYKIIRLKLDDRYKTYYIHRLVAETFIPNKDKKEFVNHIDGNKHNNSVNNLEWAYESEAMHNQYNTHKRKGRSSNAKITYNKKKYKKYLDIANDLGIKKNTFYKRLRLNWSLYEALEIPVGRGN